MNIKLELDDGSAFEAEANPKTFSGLASKRKFKQQFGVPAVVLSLLGHAFVDDDDGDGQHLNPELSPDQLQHVDEEYLAFLVWLELKRRCDDFPDGSWDEIVERIVDVEIGGGGEDGEDPTEAATST